MPIELHHLKHFLAVAEELHFGRAASRVGILQPALTLSIQRLENTLKVKLFVRRARNVALTTEGRAFYHHARISALHADMAVEEMRRHAAGRNFVLRVGFIAAALQQVLPRLTRALRERHPEVDLVFEKLDSRTQIDALRAGRIDLGFVIWLPADLSDIRIKTVERYPLMAVVPASWPVAAQIDVRLADLAEYPFVMYPRQLNPTEHNAMMAACIEAGFSPNVVKDAVDIDSLIAYVSAGYGMTFMRSTAVPMADGVHFISIVDMPATFSWTLKAVWSPHASSKVLDDLVGLLDRVISE